MIETIDYYRNSGVVMVHEVLGGITHTYPVQPPYKIDGVEFPGDNPEGDSRSKNDTLKISRPLLVQEICAKMWSLVELRTDGVVTFCLNESCLKIGGDEFALSALFTEPDIQEFVEVIKKHDNGLFEELGELTVKKGATDIPVTELKTRKFLIEVGADLMEVEESYQAPVFEIRTVVNTGQKVSRPKVIRSPEMSDQDNSRLVVLQDKVAGL